MTWNAIAPILLCFNVFMMFAWVSRDLPKANEMVRWAISTGERRKLGQAAGKSADGAYQIAEPSKN